MTRLFNAGPRGGGVISLVAVAVVTALVRRVVSLAALGRLGASGRRLLAGLLLCAGLLAPDPRAAGPLSLEPAMGAVRLFYAPESDLSQIDSDLLDSARREIDLAAFTLTDRRFMEALMRAAHRGVRVRIYLHPEQKGLEGGDEAPFQKLLSTRGVSVRFKADGYLMHLKSYQVDRRRLRSGAANFSFTGLRKQDNDLILIDSVEAVARFVAFFDRVWARPDNVSHQATP